MESERRGRLGQRVAPGRPPAMDRSRGGAANTADARACSVEERTRGMSAERGKSSGKQANRNSNGERDAPRPSITNRTYGRPWKVMGGHGRRRSGEMSHVREAIPQCNIEYFATVGGWRRRWRRRLHLVSCSSKRGGGGLIGRLTLCDQPREDGLDPGFETGLRVGGQPTDREVVTAMEDPYWKGG